MCRTQKKTEIEDHFFEISLGVYPEESRRGRNGTVYINWEQPFKNQLLIEIVYQKIKERVLFFRKE
ncbi:MAG: hypothetical protein A3F72_01440 [Bacteroidetes bacterium RIFCSPLOWO2_12_FULL_35_15]|nr:MAG: hypothetical protein A3F72_01440 [Bacteroidetes bacterium RIFCSPLOWO2_12_FULL_35_15]